MSGATGGAIVGEYIVSQQLHNGSDVSGYYSGPEITAQDVVIGLFITGLLVWLFFIILGRVYNSTIDKSKKHTGR